MTRPCVTPTVFSPLLTLLLGAALVVLPGCDVGVDGNGERAGEPRDVAAFSAIRSDAALDVEVVQGDTQALTVSIDSNLQDKVVTRVSDGVLYIDVRGEIGDVMDGPHILITAARLTDAKLAGTGNVDIALDQPNEVLDLFLTGSGVMRYTGRAAALGAYLSGSGDIRLEGATSDVEMTLSGSGSIRGKTLQAESASIDLSGSGDVSATVEDSVTVSLSGSGVIDLYGDANVDAYSNTGSGEISRH